MYPNSAVWLNEEIRKPIKKLLKGHRTEKRVMEYVDYLCEKYREMECYLKYCEEQDFKFKPREFTEYMLENYEPVDYDLLDEFLDEWDEDENWGDDLLNAQNVVLKWLKKRRQNTLMCLFAQNVEQKLEVNNEIQMFRAF